MILQKKGKYLFSKYYYYTEIFLSDGSISLNKWGITFNEKN